MKTENSNSDKILIAGGDSFIYGLDMLDCNPTNNYAYSVNTWPALLSAELGREYVCASFPGSSNSAITRRTILACEKNRGRDMMVVIGWSFLNRFEFKFTTPYTKTPDKIKDPEGYAFDHRSSSSSGGSWLSFNIVDLYGTGMMLKYIEPDMKKFLQDYYKHVGSDDVYEYYNTLKEILYLQNYLELHKIPYLFTSAHAFFHKKIQDENIDCLLKQMNFNNWFFYPNLKGFVQWANDNKYPKRDEHPSEEAHLAAFKLIKEYLDSKN
jgi:hypothetical protein